MAEILGWLDGYEERYQELGAVVIDATLPLEDVVDNILKGIDDEKSQL